MKAQLILGNQLFDPSVWPSAAGTKPVVFMREDRELCTHFKYHKHKIVFFLSAMRKYAKILKEQGFKVHYEKLADDGQRFENALAQFLKEKKVTHLRIFEIEDKFFERRIFSILKKVGCEVEVVKSLMFLTSRTEFSEYLKSSRKPFMKTFYEGQRRRMKILIEKGGAPTGGQWSFDAENRESLPKGYNAPALPQVTHDDVDRSVMELVEREFSDHPGSAANFWLPTDRSGALLWLKDFLINRLRDFGPYEDALSRSEPFLNHSVLTPFLNTGLLTPEEVVRSALAYGKKHKIPMNSLEGFVRQVIGWREFIRGIYQGFSEKQDDANFWNHRRKLNRSWYTGETGIEPLDDVIKKTVRYGYAHHIERLMVVGSLMLLLQVDPREAHRWFMEMFVDSSDWVMGPNVYGMALFSDGGIFATKPYFCGSNYYRKMGGYKTGEWQDGVDGLYWSFIENHKAFFLRNPRLSMMVRTVEKMDKAKKAKIYRAADELRARITTEN